MSRDMNWKPTSMAGRRNYITPRALRMGVLSVALAGLSLTGATGGPVTTPAIHSPIARPVASRAFVVVRNPHLHVANVYAPAKHAEHRLHGARHLAVALQRPLWRHRWSYHSWAVGHRGLGMVEGIVRDKRGRPIPFAVVLLKGPKGHPLRKFAMRHTTRTNANGYFVMLGVRAQRYRVAAHKSKSYGHVQLAVHTGGVSKAQIRI
jgi:hypothetical protein